MLNLCHEAVEPCKTGTCGGPQLALPNAEFVAEQILGVLVDTSYSSIAVDRNGRTSHPLKSTNFTFHAAAGNLFGDTHNSGHPTSNICNGRHDFWRKRLGASHERHAPVAPLHRENSTSPLMAASRFGDFLMVTRMPDFL